MPLLVRAAPERYCLKRVTLFYLWLTVQLATHDELEAAFAMFSMSIAVARLYVAPSRRQTVVHCMRACAPACLFVRVYACACACACAYCSCLCSGQGSYPCAVRMSRIQCAMACCSPCNPATADRLSCARTVGKRASTESPSGASTTCSLSRSAGSTSRSRLNRRIS